MIATRRTRLIRISISEDNKDKVWLTVWFFFHFSLSTLEVRDKDFNINFLFKIYPYKYFVLNFSSQKFNMFANFSFSSLNWAKEFKISLSPLETGKMNSGFSFSSRNWARKFEISLSPLETRQRNLDFSFSSRNWEMEFRFLFLLSNVEKLFLSFSFSSRLGFFASRQWLKFFKGTHHLHKNWRQNFCKISFGGQSRGFVTLETLIAILKTESLTSWQSLLPDN